MNRLFVNATAFSVVVLLVAACYFVWFEFDSSSDLRSSRVSVQEVKPLSSELFVHEQMAEKIKEEESAITLCAALSKEETYEDERAFRFIVSGEDGWIFRTDMDLKYDLELSDWSKASFARLQDAFEHNGTYLSVVMIPTRGIVGGSRLLPPFSESYDYQRAKTSYIQILDDLQNAGLIVADTRDADSVDSFFLKRDNHWTAKGAKYIAQRMAESIKRHPVYKTLRKTQFRTIARDAGDRHEANDRFLRFVEDVCGKKPQAEFLEDLYDTVPAEENVNENVLFGDVEAPEVVLLGTSNSTNPKPSYANFEGF